MHEWVNLTTRMGQSISRPTPSQLRDALEELFSSQDEEHPDCWIECGAENGPLHSFSFFSSGRGIYTKYSDADMTEEIQKKEHIVPDSNRALQLWEHLIDERYEEI